MSKQSDKVVAGFAKLSDADRVTAYQEIIGLYHKQEGPEKAVQAKQYCVRAGVDTGPVDSSGCPCCGR